MNPVHVNVQIESLNHEYPVTFNEVIKGGGGSVLPWYDGSYSIIPKAREQVLETKQKSVKENIVVEKIPYSAVQNLSGGNTVNIAFQ